MTNIEPARLQTPPPSEVAAFLARSLHDQMAISQAFEVRALQAEASLAEVTSERDALKSRLTELEARPAEKPASAAAEQNAS